MFMYIHITELIDNFIKFTATKLGSSVVSRGWGGGEVCNSIIGICIICELLVLLTKSLSDSLSESLSESLS